MTCLLKVQPDEKINKTSYDLWQLHVSRDHKTNLFKVLELLRSQKMITLIELLINWSVLLAWTQIPKMKHFHQTKAKVGI